MLFEDKTFHHGNFRNLGFELFIIIKKDLLKTFGEDRIHLLENQLYQLFNAHNEFIEKGMSVIIKLLPKEKFSYGAATISYREKSEFKICIMDINADYYFKNPEYRYPMLVHEFTHWHDRAVFYRWNKSHLVSESQEVNLLSMVLHSLRWSCKFKNVLCQS